MDLLHEELTNDVKEGIIHMQNANLKGSERVPYGNRMDIYKLVNNGAQLINLKLDKRSFDDMWPRTELIRCKYYLTTNNIDVPLAKELTNAIKQSFENKMVLSKISILNDNGQTVIIIWI